MPLRSVAAQVRSGFPGAVPAADFVARWQAACAAQGFDEGTSLLVVAVCRDELCEPFVGQLEAAFGAGFHAGSMGGLLTIGRTGMMAAAHHAPDGPGQPLRYVVVAAAHIGMAEGGEFGHVRRAHQSELSRSCGALMTFHDELLTGRLRLGFDPEDPEMSLLRQKLLSAIDYGDVPDPVALTRIVAAVIDEDLRALLTWFTAQLAPQREASVALVTGVLVNTVGGDWFQAHSPGLLGAGSGWQPLDLGAGVAVPARRPVVAGGVGFPAAE